MRNIRLVPPVAVGLLLLSGCAQPPPPFKMVATAEDLMAAVVEPIVEKLFEIGGTVSTAEGVRKIAPRDEEEWNEAKHGAMAVAEIGNLLKSFEPRAKEAEWTKMAQDMIDTATAMSKAAEAHNPDAVFEAGGHLYAACTACHKKYFPQVVDTAPIQ